MDKLKYFCCICMNRREQLCSLSDVDSDNVKYLTKLSFCVPKETWGEFYQICNSCIDQLNTAYTFLKVCLESERFRKEQLEDKNPETDLQLAENTKEIQFTCYHCNKSFKQKRYLCQHITKLHVKKQRKENIIQKSNEEEIKLEDNDDIKVEVELDNAKKNVINLELTLADNECPLKSESDDEDSDNYFDESYLSENEELDDKPTKFKSVKKRSVKCPFCPLTFPRGTKRRVHILTEHTSEKPFSCDQCEARYMSAYSLRIHKRKHTNEKPFVCSICGKSFTSSVSLNQHNKIHNSHRAYSCPICDRSFKTRGNLYMHRLHVHVDPSEWKFLCHICNKKFPIRSYLVKHLKIHAGVKEFDCKICGKNFIRNVELKLHFQTHSKQKPLKCRLCSKEYRAREGLRRHLKVVHGEGNWKPPKDKRVACPLCPRVFSASNDNLQRHIYTHTGERPYKCDYCQRGFTDNYKRKVHYKKDHNLELCD